MLDGAGTDAASRAGKRHKTSKHAAQQQAAQQQQANWQSEDSASDSGSSDGEGGAARSKDGNDSDEDDLHWPLSITETSTSLRYLQIQLLITVLRYSGIDIALTVKYVINLVKVKNTRVEVITLSHHSILWLFVGQLPDRLLSYATANYIFYLASSYIVSKRRRVEATSRDENWDWIGTRKSRVYLNISNENIYVCRAPTPCQVLFIFLTNFLSKSRTSEDKSEFFFSTLTIFC